MAWFNGRKNAVDNHDQSLTGVLSTTDRRSVNYSSGGVGLFGREKFPLRKHFEGFSKELFTTVIFFSPLTPVAYPTRMHVPISLTGAAHVQRLRPRNSISLPKPFSFLERIYIYTCVYTNAKDMCMVSDRCPCLCNACTSGSIKRD